MFWMKRLKERLVLIETEQEVGRVNLARAFSRVEKIEKNPNQSIVTCERCGCAVIKDDAKLGGKKVAQREIRPKHASLYGFPRLEDYVKSIYYCKRCAGKNSKEEKFR